MKKFIKILIVCLLIAAYVLIVYFVFNKKDTNSNPAGSSTTDDTSSYYMVINNEGNLLYKNNKWNSATSDDIENSNMLFNAYVNNNYLGEYYLKYSTVWSLFDKDDNYKNYKGDLIAYSNNFKVVLSNTSSSRLTDDDKAFIKSNYKIDNYDYLINEQVYNIDLDGNGEKDKLVSLTNTDVSQLGIPYYYNLIYLVLNNNLQTIIHEEKEDAISNYYVIKTIFKKDSDVSKSIIINKITGFESDESSNNIQVYEDKNNQYTID